METSAVIEQEEDVKLRLLGLALLIVSGAFGQFIVDLDTEYSGATPPSGPAPWVTATFSNIGGGGVELQIALNLTGSEFLSRFAFNLDPALDPDLYPVTHFSGDMPVGIDSGINCCTVAAGSSFDYELEYDNSPPVNRFQGTETSVLHIGAGDPSVTIEDFMFTSVNGAAGKTGFYAAAHIQGIGTSGNASGWITGDPRPPQAIPEPGSIALLGTALVGAFFHLRNRRAAVK
jgi:hypothetical protein